MPVRPFSKLTLQDDEAVAKELDRALKLQQVIKTEIRTAGFAPMSLARFMELALMHP